MKIWVKSMGAKGNANFEYVIVSNTRLKGRFANLKTDTTIRGIY